MPTKAKRREVIRLKSRRGRLIHATASDSSHDSSLARFGRTMCGVRCDGWTISDGFVTCVRCLQYVAGQVRK